MALQLEYTTKHGFTCEDAYAKIHYLSGLRTISFSVVIYKDADARQTSKEIIGQDLHTFEYDLNSSDNLIEQAYGYLKTLDAYADSEDC